MHIGSDDSQIEIRTFLPPWKLSHNFGFFSATSQAELIILYFVYQTPDVPKRRILHKTWKKSKYFLDLEKTWKNLINIKKNWNALNEMKKTQNNWNTMDRTRKHVLYFNN